MTRPCWLRRAVRNRHRHAVEQASRRWRGGHDAAEGGDAPRRLISTRRRTRAGWRLTHLSGVVASLGSGTGYSSGARASALEGCFMDLLVGGTHMVRAARGGAARRAGGGGAGGGAAGACARLPGGQLRNCTSYEVFPRTKLQNACQIAPLWSRELMTGGR